MQSRILFHKEQPLPLTQNASSALAREGEGDVTELLVRIPSPLAGEGYGENHYAEPVSSRYASSIGAAESEG
jgi:hypothetical protein